MPTPDPAVHLNVPVMPVAVVIPSPAHFAADSAHLPCPDQDPHVGELSIDDAPIHPRHQIRPGFSEARRERHPGQTQQQVLGVDVAQRAYEADLARDARAMKSNSISDECHI